LRLMAAAGVAGPLAARLLPPASAEAQTRPAFTPTRRGGGGPLKALWWQAPTLLNPHFATGTKDQDAARIFYEPLAGFEPGGNVRGELNTAYHVANRPFFDTLEMKGGGDAASAARAVLQTGEFDYAWNLQVEEDILRRLEQGGKGRVVVFPTGGPEHIQLNNTDPFREGDGERSSTKTTHPTLSDAAVRAALN